MPTQICEKNRTRWDVRWSTPNKQSVIPPNLSDEVTKIRCEMKYPARLSDISPSPNIEFSGVAISHCYWHLVFKNGDFTLLLISRGQECQFHTATDILGSIMAIAHCYWHLVVKHDNFTLLLTLLLKFQSWGLIFDRCNMQYCCSSTFWQVKSADAVFTSVRYTPTFVRWSDQD